MLGLATERALAELLPSCDIHVFDPFSLTKNENATQYDDNSTGLSERIHVHPWGFANTTHIVTKAAAAAVNHNATMQLKTLQETRNELGHDRVDVLLLHCGGCEWTLDYDDIQQVLVRVTGLQNVNWFDDKWKQYALFHKQAVVVGGELGRGQSLSYLKLRSAFFA